MPGNLNLPRLGSRGVVEPTGKVKREPRRYAVADRRQDGPAIETLRSPLACEPIDLEDYSVPVRAVLFAARQPRATCKFVLGDPMSDFTYCGDRATVIVAGALTYCADCAKRTGWDRQAWQRGQDALRVAQERLNVARSRLQGEGIAIDLSEIDKPVFDPAVKP